METLTPTIPFSFRKIWNESLIQEQREPKQRDYIYATELYKPMIDRFLAMKGTQVSNLPNERSYRKFWAGNVWGFVAGLVLHQLGIVKNAEQVVNIEDLPVPVHGRLDYLVGGKPDYQKARKMIASYPFEKEMLERFMKVIENFEQSIGDNEIEEMVHEIKSCSEYVIDMIGEGGRITGHDLQIYHYLKGLNMPRGTISYISKNDSLMQDVLVKQPDAKLEAMYMNELATLKEHIDSDTRPNPLPLIAWEGKFKKQFQIEYSNYLTLVYGFKEPKDYSDSVKGKIASWNRTLARIKLINEGAVSKTGKEIKLTDKNKLSIEEIQKNGFDAYKLAEKAVISEDEETEE